MTARRPKKKPVAKKRAPAPKKKPVAKKKAPAPKKKLVAKKRAPAAKKRAPAPKKRAPAPKKKPEPRFWFVRANARPEHVGMLSDQLFALGATGLEERDDTTLTKGASDKVTVVASFPGEAEARSAKKNLSALFSPKVEVLVGDGWRDEWKKHFKPFELCAGVWITPPWEKVPPREAAGSKVLVLEPGRAFGTGLHETTSLVARVLASRRKDVEGREVLDVGTGSGILALVALALGAKQALGTDVDADVLPVARENANRNALAKRTRFATTPLDDVAAKYPVVLANIEADVLIEMAPALAGRVAPGGLLVLSGILASRKEDVRAAFAGLSLLESPSKGEWIALAYRG
jgi:ribosomal protein L11 methyltransferase